MFNISCLSSSTNPLVSERATGRLKLKLKLELEKKMLETFHFLWVCHQLLSSIFDFVSAHCTHQILSYSLPILTASFYPTSSKFSQLWIFYLQMNGSDRTGCVYDLDSSLWNCTSRFILNLSPANQVLSPAPLISRTNKSSPVIQSLNVLSSDPGATSILSHSVPISPPPPTRKLSLRCSMVLLPNSSMVYSVLGYSRISKSAGPILGEPLISSTSHAVLYFPLIVSLTLLNF